MHRFIQLACLLGMTTGMVLPACGGATKNDEHFSSGLPPSDGLSGLNQTDEARLCNSVKGFVASSSRGKIATARTSTSRGARRPRWLPSRSAR